MSEVVSFQDYQPPPRYDTIPWADVIIQEAAAIGGTYTTIDELALSPLDTDPTQPQERSFTTANGTAPALWYRVQFADVNGNLSSFSVPIQNKPGPVYTTVDELARILKVRTPTISQQKAMERVINAAASEINSEIDLAPNTVLDGWQVDICATVNLDRAADLWRHTESIPGVAGVMDDALATMPSGYARYSWERYAQRLAPLKSRFGIA